MFEDVFRTVNSYSEGVYRAKGSKFIAHVFPVESEEEVKNRLTELRKKYYDARHHCYAYILGADKAAYRINDDGEPSGTAGRPIYGQLLSKDLTNVLVIVVRYFGGTKLGVSGLIKAYKTATQVALEDNIIIEKYIEEYYKIQFSHSQMNCVMKILKIETITILNQYYEDKNIIEFKIRRNEADKVLKQLKVLEDLQITILKNGKLKS